MVMHIIQYSIDILTYRPKEVMYGGYFSMVVVLHEHRQSDLAMREDGQHLRVHEPARVPLGARAQHLCGRRRAVVVALRLFAHTRRHLQRQINVNRFLLLSTITILFFAIISWSTGSN